MKSNFKLEGFGYLRIDNDNHRYKYFKPKTIKLENEHIRTNLY